MSAHETRVLKQLGQAVRRLRVESGLSQIDLAEKAGLNHNFVGEIERGEKMASVDSVVKLAEAFEMTGSDLLKRAKL